MSDMNERGWWADRPRSYGMSDAAGFVSPEPTCSVCEETGVGATWQGVCACCWVTSVESGVHAVEEIPEPLRARAHRAAFFNQGDAR